MKGVTIILIKGYSGKSRLSFNETIKKKLIDALAFDLYFAVLDTTLWKEPWDNFIATSDKTFLRHCRRKKYSTIDLKPGGLNTILRQIQQWAIKKSYDVLILCAGDIPLLTGDFLEIIKKKLFLQLAKNGKGMVVCPSRNDGVSIIAMSPVDLWTIASVKGLNNLSVIKGLDREEYPYQVIDDTQGFFDLDQDEDLFLAYEIMEKTPEYKNRRTKKILRQICKNVNYRGTFAVSIEETR